MAMNWIIVVMPFQRSVLRGEIAQDLACEFIEFAVSFLRQLAAGKMRIDQRPIDDLVGTSPEHGLQHQPANQGDGARMLEAFADRRCDRFRVSFSDHCTVSEKNTR